MDTGQWKQVRQLFQNALDVPAAEREAFINEQTNDETIRKVALELLMQDSNSEQQSWELAIRGIAKEIVGERASASITQPASTEPAAPLPEAGQQVGPYVMDRLLGRGGMGHVLLAHDTRLDRPVAIKFLTGSAGKLDSRSRPSFEREVKAASALNHPNILTVFDTGSHGKTPWLATEFIDGPTIRQRLLSESPLPVMDAIDITLQLLSALEAAHGANIMHRDIKPENVMLRQDGIVKLVDFSLAKSVDIKALADSVHGGAIGVSGPDETVFAGTVRYMSPEQALQYRVDARTDIWSLGAVFYEMLAGEQLLRGTDPLAILQQLQQLRGNPPMKKGLPPLLLPVLQKALHSDPKQRYQTASAMMVDLKAAQTKLRNRKPWVWWSVAAAVLVTVAAGAAAWYGAYGKGALRPSALTHDKGYTAEPAVSPDGKWVAYVSDRSGKGNLGLWLQANDSGSPPSLVLDNGSDVHEPDFSPDGREIVFRNSSRRGSLHVIPRTGGTPRLIADYGVAPRFSPDGKWILYMTPPETERSSQVWVAPSAGGGETRQLAADFEDAHFPIWSEDGRSILLCGTRVSGDATQEHDWWVLPFPSGAPHKTGASGDPLLHEMRGIAHQLGPPVVWRGGFVYFSTLGEGARNLALWRAKLDFANGGLERQREQLTDNAASDVQAKVCGKQIAFARGTLAIRIFEIPLDAQTGQANGPLRMLHAGAADVTFPHLNREGDLAVMQSGPGNRKIVVGRPGAVGAAVARSSNPQDYPRWSHDGKRIAFRNMQNPKVPILIANPSTGEVATACRDCGGPADWSIDDKFILFEPGATIAHIGRLNVEQGSKEDYILPRGNSLRGARYSPDGKWVAFYEELKRGLRQVHITSVDARDAKSWIDITDGTHGDSSPAWSPDGNTLYFLSDRGGQRSPWAQRLDPVTKLPAGDPFQVYKFAESRRTILQTASHREPFIGFDVYPDKIVFALDEIASNVWTADLR